MPRFIWTYRHAIRHTLTRLTYMWVLILLDRPTPRFFPRGWDHEA